MRCVANLLRASWKLSNTVLIMTSNMVGDPRDHLRPEFVNRIDDIVRFRELTEADKREFTDLINALAEPLSQLTVTVLE